MTQYIDKAVIKAEIDKRIMDAPINYIGHQRVWAYNDVKDILNTLEVKEVNSVWHNIDDIPDYNLNGISDLIVDSCYGHIYGEAHSYTPEQWLAHIGFNANRQFRWAYERDLIDFD